MTRSARAALAAARANVSGTHHARAETSLREEFAKIRKVSGTHHARAGSEHDVLPAPADLRTCARCARAH